MCGDECGTGIVQQGTCAVVLRRPVPGPPRQPGPAPRAAGSSAGRNLARPRPGSLLGLSERIRRPRVGAVALPLPGPTPAQLRARGRAPAPPGTGGGERGRRALACSRPHASGTDGRPRAPAPGAAAGRLRGVGAVLLRRAHRQPRRAPEGVRQLPRSGRHQCAVVRLRRRPFVAPATRPELASDRHRPRGVRILEPGARQLRDRRPPELGRPPHRRVRDARLAHLLGAGGGDAPGRRGYTGGAGVRHAGVPLRPPVHRLPVDLPHHAGGRRQQVHRRQGGLPARLPATTAGTSSAASARPSSPTPPRASPATAASTPPVWW